MEKHRSQQVVTIAAVVIFSSVLVSFLHWYPSRVQWQMHMLTKQRLYRVATALDLYAKTHGSYPCPASHFGPQDCTTPRVTGPDVQVYQVNLLPVMGVYQVNPATGSAVDQLDQIWVGRVPIKELGIEDVPPFTAWGDDFIYAVRRSLTLPGGDVTHGGPILVSGRTVLFIDDHSEMPLAEARKILRAVGKDPIPYLVGIEEMQQLKLKDREDLREHLKHGVWDTLSGKAAPDRRMPPASPVPSSSPPK